jgi:alkylated DNA repair dioxygenase AlkB
MRRSCAGLSTQFIDALEANAWYDILLKLDTCAALSRSTTLFADLPRVYVEPLWSIRRLTYPDQPMLKLYGRTFPQSRQIAAYGTEPGMTLKYSGSDIRMHHPYPPVLQRMQERLEEVLGVKFNHCMLNRYDDGSVMIG